MYNLLLHVPCRHYSQSNVLGIGLFNLSSEILSHLILKPRPFSATTLQVIRAIQ